MERPFLGGGAQESPRGLPVWPQGRHQQELLSATKGGVVQPRLLVPENSGSPALWPFAAPSSSPPKPASPAPPDRWSAWVTGGWCRAVAGWASKPSPSVVVGGQQQLWLRSPPGLGGAGGGSRVQCPCSSPQVQAGGLMTPWRQNLLWDRGAPTPCKHSWPGPPSEAFPLPHRGCGPGSA